MLDIFILLNCSSICGALFCVPLFTLAALCDGIKLILTISLALQKSKINKLFELNHFINCISCDLDLHYCDLCVRRFQWKSITKCSRYHNFRCVCIFDCPLEYTKIINAFYRNSLSNPIFTHDFLCFIFIKNTRIFLNSILNIRLNLSVKFK